MELIDTPSFSKRKKAQLLVIPFWKSGKTVSPAAHFDEVLPLAVPALHSGDFKGKEGEFLVVYSDKLPEHRLALLGLGEENKVTIEKLRRAYHKMAKACHSLKVEHVNFYQPVTKGLDSKEIFKGTLEGILLTNYVFEKNKSKKDDTPTTLLKKIAVINAPAKSKDIFDYTLNIAQAVYLTRDLVNDNAHEITPQFLAKLALDLGKKLPHVKTTVFDKKRIEKEKMGLLLAVNQGAANDPAFIIIEYQGNPRSKERTALVGKGVTYDTGGLNLKPTGFMETMRCDMAGAATVIGIIKAAATTGLKQNIIGIIPATENAIDSTSFKPGDIYTSYLGKTIEIANTDAEGRLILADALAYAVKHFKPTRIIDLATLTGAMVVALGEELTGFMTNDESLAKKIKHAGEVTFERAWQMPLYDEYKDMLKSDFADLKNAGSRMGGAITAAMFLKEFVDKTPWIHLDIAGTAYQSESKSYRPKNATGIGVRLLIEFLQGLA